MDWANILSGILSGAGAGSALGPWGAVGGGALGGLGGIFSGKKEASQGPMGQKGGSFWNTPSTVENINRLSPQQQSLQEMIGNLLTGQGQQPTDGLLGNMFSEKGFKNFSDPALRMYNEEIVPGLAEKFSGGFGVPGAASAQGSSGFQNALAKSGQDLAQGLGEFRGRQQQDMLGNLLTQFMTPQSNQYYQPSGPSGLAQLLSSLAGGLGDAGINLGSSWAKNKLGI